VSYEARHRIDSSVARDNACWQSITFPPHKDMDCQLMALVEKAICVYNMFHIK
jgi:hypothetical protein